MQAAAVDFLELTSDRPFFTSSDDFCKRAKNAVSVITHANNYSRLGNLEFIKSDTTPADAEQQVACKGNDNFQVAVLIPPQ
jgi:hypothetical protein